MSDEEELQPLDRRSPEETLTRELATLGPLMARQEQLEAEGPDAAFVATLRARLVSEPLDGPDPQFAARLRAQVLRSGQRSWWRRTALAGVAAAVLAAALVAIILVPRLPHRGTAPPLAMFPGQPGPPRPLTWSAPSPMTADLVRGYPSTSGAGGGGPGYAFLSPEQTALDPLGGVPFTGKVVLTAGALPALSAQVPVYRLGGAISSAAQLAAQAHRLGIGASAAFVPTANATWLVAATGIPARGLPLHLHSLAVSQVTGELIYHDARPLSAVQQRPALDARSAVAAARAWVSALGWPGARMPLQSAHSGIAYGAPYAAHSWTIQFGWISAAPDESSAATLWLAPGGKVLEARLWPAAAASTMVAARSVAAAWDGVRHGAFPLAVNGILDAHATGRGALKRVTLAYVLTADGDGVLYLAPVYHFSGSAVFVPGGALAAWFALAPAANAP